LKDDKTKTLPFDIGDLNCHTYSSSLHIWEQKEIDEISKHIVNAKTATENQLWKYFGVSVAASSLPSPGEKIS